VSGSVICWAICKSAPQIPDNHANIPPLSFFTGRMPFLSPNQQCQSTEGTKWSNIWYMNKLLKYNCIELCEYLLPCDILQCTFSFVSVLTWYCNCPLNCHTWQTGHRPWISLSWSLAYISCYNTIMQYLPDIKIAYLTFLHVQPASPALQPVLDVASSYRCCM